MSFGTVIKNIRLNALMSQIEFGKELGVSFTTINRWENNKAIPNLKAMKAIEKFCKEYNIESDLKKIYVELGRNHEERK